MNPREGPGDEKAQDLRESAGPTPGRPEVLIEDLGARVPRALDSGLDVAPRPLRGLDSSGTLKASDKEATDLSSEELDEQGPETLLQVLRDYENKDRAVRLSWGGEAEASEDEGGRRGGAAARRDSLRQVKLSDSDLELLEEGGRAAAPQSKSSQYRLRAEDLLQLAGRFGGGGLAAEGRLAPERPRGPFFSLVPGESPEAGPERERDSDAGPSNRVIRPGMPRASSLLLPRSQRGSQSGASGPPHISRPPSFNFDPSLWPLPLSYFTPSPSPRRTSRVSQASRDEEGEQEEKEKEEEEEEEEGEPEKEDEDGMEMEDAPLYYYDSASKQFAGDILKAHNEYRRRHGCPPLKLDSRLNREAQQYADALATTKILKHSSESSRGNCGENLAWASYDQTGQDVADRWYSEMKNYDFKSPGFSPESGHFTAMIWKNTKKMGVGKASANDGSSYVVARYFPAGNIVNPGFFEENIPRPEKK
ncbi:Golgi-associated plant pathogenesis-related protein 1 isoform X1 [Notamacropus eugenii]|uniref:Golgi-associated plant pathogenesis-related protein 1 isoform X1 n=1 Tax=Notamacropus eugenii TaxID=9315 RepID=UPI003B66CDC3